MSMNKVLFVLLFVAFAAYGQQQERVAIINTMDNLDSINFSDLSYLTNRLRETAVKVLPKSRYGIMTTESIVAFLGSGEQAAKVCNEASCLAEIGRKVSADYVAQGRIGRFNGELTINFELYNSRSGNLIGSFTGSSDKISGLLAIIDDKAPELFKEMPDGTSDVEKATNFGFLDIKPAYLEGIGANKDWYLTINGKAQFSYKNRLSPGNYEVRLSHECYEDVSFRVGINKDRREVFDMEKNISLKKGGLDLSAERNGKLVSELVFVNGRKVGETPFIGSVPLCADIGVGSYKNKVNVRLVYNQIVKHKHQMAGDGAYGDLMSKKERFMEKLEARRNGTVAGAVGEYHFNDLPTPEPEKTIKNSLWLAISLDLIGVAFIYTGYKMSELERRDNGLEMGNIRNTTYVLGGIFLASGIGVSIWF